MLDEHVVRLYSFRVGNHSRARTFTARFAKLLNLNSRRNHVVADLPLAMLDPVRYQRRGGNYCEADVVGKVKGATASRYSRLSQFKLRGRTCRDITRIGITGGMPVTDTSNTAAVAACPSMPKELTERDEPKELHLMFGRFIASVIADAKTE